MITDLNPFLYGSFLTISVSVAILVTFFILNRRISDSDAMENSPELPFSGPLARLDFNQSLDPVLFAEAAEEETMAYVKLHLRDNFADAATLTLQSLRQLLARSELVVGASDAGAKALLSGAAKLQVHKETGRVLPYLVDSKTGEVNEFMKGVGSGRRFVSNAAAVSTIAVSVAHIIATADIARKLAKANANIDLLLAYRRIDQSARLERIYTFSQELLASPIEELKRMEIWRLRSELRELRAIWRGEVEHHLREVTDPSKDAFVDWMFTSTDSYDSKITRKISEGHLRFLLIEYALRLDCVLAVASSTLELSRVTMADEIVAIAKIEPLLAERMRFIAEKRRIDVQQVLDGFSTMIKHYDQALPTERRISGYSPKR
jgi:hypothetical protein